MPLSFHEVALKNTFVNVLFYLFLVVSSFVFLWFNFLRPVFSFFLERRRGVSQKTKKSTNEKENLLSFDSCYVSDRFRLKMNVHRGIAQTVCDVEYNRTDTLSGTERISIINATTINVGKRKMEIK